MSHTPTPWRVSKLKSLPFVVCNDKGVILANCDVAEDYITRVEAQANAAFIVEACNAHERFKRDYKVIANERACLRSANKTLQRERDALKEAVKSKATIRIQLGTDEQDHVLLGIARDAFPEATSITIESDDGTSETIYTRKP